MLDINKKAIFLLKHIYHCNLLYLAAFSLAKEFGVEEKWSESCGQQIEITFLQKQSRNTSIGILGILPFLNIAFAEKIARSVKKRRWHIMDMLFFLLSQNNQFYSDILMFFDAKFIAGSKMFFK